MEKEEQREHDQEEVEHIVTQFIGLPLENRIRYQSQETKVGSSWIEKVSHQDECEQKCSTGGTYTDQSSRFDLVIFLPFFILLFILGFRSDSADRHRGLLAGAGFSTIFLTWVGNNLLSFGTVFNKNSLGTIVKMFYRYNPQPQGRYTDAHSFLSADTSFIDLVMMDPLFLVKKWFYILGNYLYLDIIHVIGIAVVVLIVLSALLFPPWKLNRRQRNMLYFAMLSLGILALSHHRLRYSLPHMFIYFICAFYPLSRFITKRGKIYRNALYTFLTLFLAVIFFFSIQKSMREMVKGPYEILPVAEFLKKNVPQKNKLLTSKKPHIAYYADLPWTPLIGNVSSAEELAKWALQNNITYLYWSSYDENLYPQFQFLSGVMKHGAWIPLIHTDVAVLYYLERPEGDLLK